MLFLQCIIDIVFLFFIFGLSVLLCKFFILFNYILFFVLYLK